MLFTHLVRRGLSIECLFVIGWNLSLLTKIKLSGTTGRPKGVDVTHGNVANLVCSEPGSLGIQPGVRVGHVLSISFDMGKLRVPKAI